MRNLFRFYGIFVFIGLLFLTVSCAGGGSGDGGISYDDDDSATSSSSSAAVFTVTYYSDADGVSAPSVTKASVGGSVTITTTKPVREGYVFIGWATSSGGTVKYQPGSKVVLKVSISLYAVWKEGTPATYTVRHVMPDGTAADTQSGLTGVSGGNTNATANEYPGYHPSGVPNTSIADDGSTVVNISYAANTYTIAFNTNGGTGGSTASAPATYGSSISLTPNGFTKTGYSFAGWNTKSDGTGTAYSDKASVSNLTSENGVTITLYAMWKPNTYTVKFDANGGTGSMANMGATYDKAMNLPANTFKRKGFAFSGWGSSADASSPAHSNSESVKNLTADNGVTITLYALWTEGAYSITFNANGGSGTMADQTASSASPTSLSSNGFTRTGYTFAGWAKTPSASTPAYTDGQGVSALTDDDAVTLYAVWKANTYTIKFDANGGTGSMDDQSATYDKAAALSANKFSRSGYKFAGWSTSSSATGSDYAGGASVKNLTADNGATVTLYAVWSENVCKISFDSNGGSGSMGDQTAGSSSSINANSFTKTGYSFEGWSTTPGATTATYTDAQSAAALANGEMTNVTLYAVWKPITYTIKFDANGGTGDMAAIIVKYDEWITIPLNKFSKSGYKFYGWRYSAADTKETKGGQIKNLAKVDGAVITMQVVWEEANFFATVKTSSGDVYYCDDAVSLQSQLSKSTGTVTVTLDKGFSSSSFADLRTALKKASCPVNLDFNNRVTSIPQSALYGCLRLRNVVISSSVTSIGEYAFSASGLTSVTIPGSVFSISKGAFSSCKSLKSVIINSGVKEILEGAFSDCSVLNSVSMANGVTGIGTSAFLSCSSLVSVSIPNTVTSLGESAFSSTGLTAVTVPGSISSISKSAFSNCASLETVILENGVKTISQGAFYQCTKLRSVSIPNSVTEVGISAFSNCKSLSSIDIPGSVKVINVSAFNTCTNLKDVTLHSGLQEIQSFAFSTCTKLKSISIPSTVIIIGQQTFYDSGLISVVIPAKVDWLYSGAFYANNLSEIHYAGTMAEWRNLGKNSNWARDSNGGAIATEILCSDGSVAF